MVSGSASVPRGVSETISENVLSKKETSQPLVDEGEQFDDEDKNDEGTKIQRKDSVHILVSGSALVQSDLSETVSESVLSEKQTEPMSENVLGIASKTMFENVLSENDKDKSDETVSENVLSEKQTEPMSETVLRVGSKTMSENVLSENNEDKNDDESVIFSDNVSKKPTNCLIQIKIRLRLLLL